MKSSLNLQCALWRSEEGRKYLDCQGLQNWIYYNFHTIKVQSFSRFSLFRDKKKHCWCFFRNRGRTCSLEELWIISSLPVPLCTFLNPMMCSSLRSLLSFLLFTPPLITPLHNFYRWQSFLSHVVSSGCIESANYHPSINASVVSQLKLKN